MYKNTIHDLSMFFVYNGTLLFYVNVIQYNGSILYKFIHNWRII